MQAQIREGSVVEIEETDGMTTIRAVTPKEHTLDELVSGITEENRHGEVDTGEATGNEVW